MNKPIIGLAAVFSLALALLAGHGCRTRSFPAKLPLAGEELKWGVALDGYPITSARMQHIRDEIGVFPDIVVFFLAWPEHGNTKGTFPLDSLDAIHDAEAVPCLTWEPMYFKDGIETTISAESILAGEYDMFLSDFARSAALWNRTLLIRFAHEMNLARYHWGGTAADYGPDSPGMYRQMFRYIVRLFREANADNVFWVFCPNAESVPQDDWNRIAAYYPGDDVVDYLGMDGYNWGASQTTEQHGWNSRWQTFAEIFGRAHVELRAIDPKKPLLIFETASVGSSVHQSAWLADALETSREWNIDGIIWFQADKENDWRLLPDSARVLKNFLNKPSK